ncbi:hypothetical protein CW702_01070 [Candidatus Bathyarchaeota archaeon]|nr:MAG: hypothetical protein CW702_01070 [Candidatus Bathyarchaeota archaeon]
MSEKSVSGMSILEKAVGLVITIIGSILAYQTYVNQKAAGLSATLFVLLGIAIMFSGVILIVAKTK